MALIDQKALLAIDGGLSYIVHRYPDARESEGKPNRKFKVRQEKTASAGLKWHKDGFWMVTDFGGDSKGRNAIQICMLEDNVDFAQAIRTVAAFYNFAPEAAPSIQPGYNCWPARPEESEGLMTFAFKEFDLFDLRCLFAEYAWRALGRTDDDRKKNAVTICAYYHLKCLASYTYTKEGKTHEYSSNEQFPIFLWDEGNFKKLYKPKGDKKFRFQTYGEKPAGFIHGLAQAQKKRAELEASGPATGGNDDDDDDKPRRPGKEVKLPELVYCSGGSDALNVAALGLNVVWPNSETAELMPADFRTMARLADDVYNLPDIDVTGLKAAHALAMKYLELRTIYLPASLRIRLDSRGNPCKDVRDFLAYYPKHAFMELMETALPYQFWDVEVARDKDGKEKIKFGRVQFTYQFNNVHGYNFLYRNGFARFASEKEKDGFVYVRIENNIVRPIMGNEIKYFIHSFLEDRKMGIDLRNTIYRSPQLSESSLSNLPMFTGDFKAYGPDFQYLFFEKSTWKVTAKGIQEERAGAVDKYIWDHKVIRQKVSVKEPMFKIFQNDAGQWDIDVKDTGCMFFRFLIQTCRVHWRTELEERMNLWQKSRAEQLAYAEKNQLSDDDLAEILAYQNADEQARYRKEYQFAIDGPLLLPEEIAEQKGHLINRIFSIGYMLHRFKNPAKPWAVFAMDNKLSDEGESHGGAGKGLVAKGLYKLLSKVQLDGRNTKLTENPHVFENVDVDTDFVHVEDANEYLPFGFFFAPLTSAMTINPKNKRSFELGFDDSPKFWFDTNFGDRYTDPSSLRRKLYTVFGDYYHENNGEYSETRTPLDDFGKNLFQDFDDNDWNCFYNFMAQCLAFFLSTDEKISPPMGNVSRRNLMSEMGDHFRNWADVYFAPESGRLDNMLAKEDAMNDCINYTKMKHLTAQRFTKSLKAWCSFHAYQLNPAELLNSQGRLIRNVMGKSTEMIYLRSDKDKPVNREIR